MLRPYPLHLCKLVLFFHCLYVVAKRRDNELVLLVAVEDGWSVGFTGVAVGCDHVPVAPVEDPLDPMGSKDLITRDHGPLYVRRSVVTLADPCFDGLEIVRVKVTVHEVDEQARGCIVVEAAVAEVEALDFFDGHGLSPVVVVLVGDPDNEGNRVSPKQRDDKRRNVVGVVHGLSPD